MSFCLTHFEVPLVSSSSREIGQADKWSNQHTVSLQPTLLLNKKRTKSTCPFRYNWTAARPSPVKVFWNIVKKEPLPKRFSCSLETWQNKSPLGRLKRVLVSGRVTSYGRDHKFGRLVWSFHWQWIGQSREWSCVLWTSDWWMVRGWRRTCSLETVRGSKGRSWVWFGV